MKRLLAIVMTLCMVFGVSGIGVYADELEEAVWQYETPMPTAMWGLSAATVGNKIYAIGGTANAVEIFDTSTKTWSTGAPMPTARREFTTTVADNKIYAIGGWNGLDSNALEIYDTTTNTWTKGASIPQALVYPTTAVVDGKIYVFGERLTYIYDIATNSWGAGTNMPTARYWATSVSINNQIYVIGGYNYATSVNTVEIYDTNTDTWQAGSPMPTRRGSLNSVVVDGNKIYTIGGTNGPSFNTVEIYDILSNTWSTGPSLNKPKYAAGAALAGDTIYVIGGNPTTTSVESLKVGKPDTYLLSVLLNVSEQVQLSVTHNLSDNTPLTWTSSNEEVATVDTNGKVTAVGAGTVLIYAENEDGTFKESIPVKVLPGGADLFRLAVHLNAGQQAKLYLSDDTENIVWSSMDESIATVSADGVVTGVSKGLVIVQGEIDGESYQIYVRVNS